MLAAVAAVILTADQPQRAAMAAVARALLAMLTAL